MNDVCSELKVVSKDTAEEYLVGMYVSALLVHMVSWLMILAETPLWDMS